MTRGTLAAVAMAWLMPWRAVRTIRRQQQDISLLIRVAADLMTPAEPPADGRPRLRVVR